MSGRSEGRALILVPTHRNRDRLEVAISGKRWTSPVWDDSWAYLGKLRVVVDHHLPAFPERVLNSLAPGVGWHVWTKLYTPAGKSFRKAVSTVMDDLGTDVRS